MISIGVVYQLEGFVFRTIVNKNYFKRRIFSLQQALDRFYSGHLLVIPRHNYAYGGQRSRVDRCRNFIFLFIVGVLAYCQDSDQDYPSDRQENCGKEQVDQEPVSIKIKFDKEII